MWGRFAYMLWGKFDENMGHVRDVEFFLLKDANVMNVSGDRGIQKQLR